MVAWAADRKSTRLNSSHLVISYAVFCLKKKKDLVAPHLQRGELEHAADQDDAPTRHVQVGGGIEAHPAPPQTIDAGSRERNEEHAQDECRDYEQDFPDEQRPAAAASVHLPGP